MVVYYFRHAPVLLTEKGAPQLPLRPDPRLFEAAKQLGGLADFLVIPPTPPTSSRRRSSKRPGARS